MSHATRMKIGATMHERAAVAVRALRR